ncbi:hypothetical protein G9A89_015903 [Geosiphon pyriformis]|nr:hypothetical protein G9A89_015903 [Geosiphon pyriformis]
MSSILDQFLYYKSVFSLRWFSVAFGDRLFDKKRKMIDWKTFQYWQWLDLRDPVPYWFMLASDFMNNSVFLEVRTAAVLGKDELNVLDSEKFAVICDSLLKMQSNCIKIYMDKFLKDTSSSKVTGGAAVYFPAANMSIGIRVAGLLSFTLTELHAVALALEYVLFLCSVVLHSDNQSAIDACVFEIFFTVLDFHNQFVCKGFVIRNWYAEAVLVFEKKNKTALAFVEYIRLVVELYCTKV